MTRNKRLTKSERKAIISARRDKNRFTDEADRVLINRNIRRITR